MVEEIEKKPVFFYGEGSSEARYIKDVLMKALYPQHMSSAFFILQDPVPHNGKNSPTQLLQQAVDKCKENTLAQCWCLFDGDGDHHDWKEFWKIYDECEHQTRITLVFQNSCWELWLALHLQEITSPLNESQLISILQKSVEFRGYTKGKVKFKILKDKNQFNIATFRSTTLQNSLTVKHHIQTETNPVTTMSELAKWFKNNFTPTF